MAVFETELLIDSPETDVKGNARPISVASAPSEQHLMIATRMRDTAFMKAQPGPLARHLVDFAAPAYYIAGPPAMVETMQEMLARAGVDAEDVRTDEFYGY